MARPRRALRSPARPRSDRRRAPLVWVAALGRSRPPPGLPAADRFDTLGAVPISKRLQLVGVRHPAAASLPPRGPNPARGHASRLAGGRFPRPRTRSCTQRSTSLSTQPTAPASVRTTRAGKSPVFSNRQIVVSDSPVFCRTAGFRIILRGMRPLASQTTRNQSQRVAPPSPRAICPHVHGHMSNTCPPARRLFNRARL